jgi:flagellar hook-associated protein FlgK
MHSINLKWKKFPVNLQAVENHLKTNSGSSYVGNSSDTDLTLWFSEQPHQDIKDLIQAYWDNLTEASPDAASYKSAKDVAEHNSIKLSNALKSASTKLQSLGLTDAEIAALRG